MKVVTKAELLTLREGTIFREFEPFVWHGEWMRFHGPCNDNDFFYSTIGPALAPPGHDFDRGGIILAEDLSRDGMFVDSQYVVLEDADLAAWVMQLVGSDYVAVRQEFLLAERAKS